MSRAFTRRQVLAAAAGAMLGFGACQKQETASDKPELVLRYAENQPEDYPTTQAALAFGNLLEEQTGGRVKVAVYSKGELGAEMSVIQQIQFGGIDFARVSLSQLAEYMPALNVLQLPFLYQDADQMWRVLDGSIGDEFLTRLDAIDLTGLSWFDAGVRSFYTRQKVTCLAELQGLRLRVQESDTMSMMVSALGADPVQVVYSQVYAALHNGQIDGAENNWPSYEAMSHYEVAPYFLRDEHTRVPEIQLASIPAMEKVAALDPTFPDILRSCARESALIERTLWAEQEEGAEQEMLAVSRFTDWNPTHFLDVGEMVMALAIGYDWLYDSLQPDTRRVVREAIIAKGFDAAKNTRHAWFYTAKNNWNSVCNSGVWCAGSF